MKYRITVENIVDKTDRFMMEGDSVIAFVGKLNEEKKEIEHGMGFAGSKLVMREVISTIPYQIQQMVQEDVAAAKKAAGNHVEEAPKSDIVLPSGYDNKKTKN